MPKTVDKRSGEVVDAITPAAVLQAATDLVMMVPEAPEDDGTGILARILDAKSLDDLMEDGSLPSSKNLTGRVIVVERMHRRPSDKGGRIPWFLVCEGFEGGRRKPITFTAGGEQALIKLAQCYMLGLLPVGVEFTSVTTRSGNDAINVAITAGSGTPRTIEG